MFLIAILIVLFLAGVLAIWRWGDLELQKPWEDDEVADPPPPSQFFRRYLWYVTITVVAGITSGVIMLGIGGRLVMRLLAATSSDSVQGRVTEAEEIIGKITLDGTIGFIVFFGIFGGLVTGVAYMLVRRLFPKGRLGGFIFGAVLLIALASRFDPLRPDNVDFNLVSPDWLAVLAFSAIFFGHGMLLGSIAGRVGRLLPLITKDLRTIARYIPLLLLIPVFPLAVPLAVGALLGFGASRAEGITWYLASENFLLVGRLAISVLVALSAPSFVSGVAEILWG